MKRQPPLKSADWTVLQMIEWATDFFEKKEIPSPRLSIEWLLSHVLGMKRLDLYLKFDRPLSMDELNKLKPLVLRRAEHEPLQYITGNTDFYNLTLHVDKSVLIPRPETEQLVEHILQNHGSRQPLSVLDIGTGSGCIALALKKERPSWSITGIDFHKPALETARRNARDLELDVHFHQADFTTYRPDSSFDIIVSNPPYISREEMLELADQVRRFEPETALAAENIPAVYRNLMELIHHALTTSGSFYLEINESLGAKLLEICNIYSLKSRLIKDYSDKDRFIIGKFE